MCSCPAVVASAGSDAGAESGAALFQRLASGQAHHARRGANAFRREAQKQKFG